MGNRIPAVDMLINDIIRPMLNAYAFGQYEQACNLLVQLNSFFLGFGEGVDLPIPRSICDDILSRSTPTRDYKIYYNKYSQAVFKKLGKYIREVLDSLPKQYYVPE